MSGLPRIWALLGDKTGDNNQLLALAEALGWPFETRPMRYNLVRAVPPRHLGATTASLQRSSRALITPPWPDLILAIGRRTVPVSRWIRQQSGGRTRLVLVGHPRVEPELFDLVITTAQYPVPPRPNVITLPLAMSRARDRSAPTAEEKRFFTSLPRPHLLFAIGGPTKYWELDEKSVGAALEHAVIRADRAGGTLIAVQSRRTPREVIERVEARLLNSRHRLVLGASPRFPQLLADADEIFVTADSVSMLSEAIQTGKPVGMVPISLSPRGAKVLGDPDKASGFGWGYGRRDLRRIWKQMRDDGLVGTVEAPVAGTLSGSSAEQAAAAVRRLMSDHGFGG